MSENVEAVKQKIINIYPTKNSRRILVFFADLLILFIASVFLFEMAINPLAQLISGYDERVQKADVADRSRTQILYDNDILFFEEETKYRFNYNLDFTATKFLKYYCFDLNDTSNEVIYHYFCDLRKEDVSKINEFYKEIGSNYFDTEKYTPSGTYAFKEEHINLIRPMFVEGDEITEDGKRVVESFKEACFLPLYSKVILDIKNNDLKSDEQFITQSYNELSVIVADFDTYLRNTAMVSAYVTFAISAIVLYFVVPLTNHKGRTLSEMILKVERVDKKTIEYLRKRFVVVEGLLNTISGLLILFLIPVMSFGVSKLFLLNLLYPVSFISLIFVIVQLGFLLFTKFGQTLKELSTNSICVDTSTIDEYYRERGYDN